MKTELKKDMTLESGFKVLEVVPLDELKSIGIYARHEKTGAEVFHVFNDDEENLFAFIFATAPEDSTGVAHIIEHSVLCGSENYPLKETFNVLAQGSLNTFLNALTFPDKTVYPASSLNEKDYFNLLSVYGDAVFRPRLDEWTFMQEGHRYEWKNKKLSITGVVYNEMKGAYSSLDEYAYDWSIKSVLPDTIYAFDSGGDPECIPDLTFEQFKKFHKDRYSPANCKIYLEGNIPTEKQLQFLNDTFFNNIEAGCPAPPIKLAECWKETRTYKKQAPSGSNEKCMIYLSWLCSDFENGNGLPMSILTEILLGHDGSPLTKVLIESGLGEDLAPVCGFENEIRQSVWTVGLRGVKNAGKSGAVEALILNELKRLVNEGIPKEEIEAAMLLLEFSHKEIKRAGGPWSLISMRRSLHGWLHGKMPWETLLFAPRINDIKKCLAEDNRYFEKLIQKELLDNQHRALIILESDKKFLLKKEKMQEEKLKRHAAALSKEELEAIEKKNEELARRQNAPDSSDVLKTIPHLKISDLPVEIEKTDRTIINAGNIPCIAHNIFTNNIIYCDFAFPLYALSQEEYLWLPLFVHCVNSVGLPGMDYAQVSSLFARTVGDFNAMLETGTRLPSLGGTSKKAYDCFTESWGDYIIFKLKTLEEKITPSLELVQRMIREADFSDLRHLRDLLLEFKNDADSSLAPHGSTYAVLNAGKYHSHSRAVSELWKGLTQLEFVHKVSKMKIEEICAQLTALRDKIILQSTLIINVTGTGEQNACTLRLIEKNFSSFSSMQSNIKTNNSKIAIAGNTNAVELFASHSLQVGFAGLSMSASDFASKESAAERVLCHYLSTGSLWTTLRMQGGAYGAHASVDPIERDLIFSTYRDPNPLRSIELLPSILESVSKEKIDSDMLEKTIIGTYSSIKQPHAPSAKGFLDFIRFLYNIGEDQRLVQLENVLHVTSPELAEAAARFSCHLKNAQSAILASPAQAKSAAKKTGLKIQKLPV